MFAYIRIVSRKVKNIVEHCQRCMRNYRRDWIMWNVGTYGFMWSSGKTGRTYLQRDHPEWGQFLVRGSNTNVIYGSPEK